MRCNAEGPDPRHIQPRDLASLYHHPFRHLVMHAQAIFGLPNLQPMQRNIDNGGGIEFG